MASWADSIQFPTGLLGGPTEQPGLLDRFTNGIGNNPNLLMSMGAALLGGHGFGGALQGGMAGAQIDKKNTIQDQSFRALMQIPGMTPEKAFLAINNPEIMKSAAPSLFPKKEFQNVDNTMVSFDPYSGRAAPIGAVPKFEKWSGEDNTAMVSNPNVPRFGVPAGAPMAPAPAPSLPPSPAVDPSAPLTANRVPTTSPPLPAGVSSPYFTPLSQGVEKPPQKYTWNVPGDPSKGATRIPGTEEPLSSEEAGRLSMIQSAKQGVETARQYFLSPGFNQYSGAGGVTSPQLFDVAGKAIGQATGIGEIARQRTNVERGIEAALRIATGANAPESEVKRYANFYLPSVYDSVETRTQKLDALQRFMTYAESNMSAGHLVPLKQLSPDQFINGGTGPAPIKTQARVSSSAYPPPPPGFVVQ